MGKAPAWGGFEGGRKPREIALSDAFEALIYRHFKGGPTSCPCRTPSGSGPQEQTSMSDPVTLPLGSDCSIQAVKPLQADLIAAFAEAEAVTLDCARIERADIAFVQIVLAASATAERRGKRLGLANMPAPVEAAFHRAGIAAALFAPR